MHNGNQVIGCGKNILCVQDHVHIRTQHLNVYHILTASDELYAVTRFILLCAKELNQLISEASRLTYLGVWGGRAPAVKKDELPLVFS